MSSQEPAEPESQYSELDSSTLQKLFGNTKSQSQQLRVVLRLSKPPSLKPPPKQHIRIPWNSVNQRPMTLGPFRLPKQPLILSRKQHIRISARIWNSVQPEHQPTRSSATRVRCKHKIARFIPGGPNRETKGLQKNDTYLRGPCLEETCAYCRQNHPHLMGLPELPKLERSAEGDKMEILVDDVDVVINKGSVREDEMKMDIDSNESQKESSGEQMDEDGDIEMENESAEEGSQIRSRQRIRLTFQSKEVKKTFRTIVERMEGGC